MLLAVPLLAIVATLLRELVVFDVLGKRGHIPYVLETPTGELVLDMPPSAVPEEAAPQETPLTDENDEPDVPAP